MKLPHRRQFLHLAAGAAALPAVSRIARAQTYPTRPVRIVVAFGSWRRDRHSCAADRTMAVGAARPAIRRREPPGRAAPTSAPKRSCVRHRTATHFSWSSTANAINATLYDKLNFNFLRDIAPVAGIISIPDGHGGKSIGSGQDGSRIYRLCQGQFRQDQYGIARHRDTAACCRRAVQDDDRRRYGSRAISRRATRDDRPAWRAGAGSVRLHVSDR